MSQQDALELANKCLASISLHIHSITQEDIKLILYELATAIKHIIRKLS